MLVSNSTTSFVIRNMLSVAPDRCQGDGTHQSLIAKKIAHCATRRRVGAGDGPMSEGGLVPLLEQGVAQGFVQAGLGGLQGLFAPDDLAPGGVADSPAPGVLGDEEQAPAALVGGGRAAHVR